jgi:hypothetical protein
MAATAIALQAAINFRRCIRKPSGAIIGHENGSPFRSSIGAIQ